MAIKGKSVIELYNPNTKIKQRYEDENIVTNVFNYLFGQNYFATAGQSFFENFVPLFKNGIGGIILFDDRIEENPNIVVAPNTVGCTGYASNGAYSGSDLSRGGMNLNETKLIENGMKFVWDFATSQANGDIACISLTSADGGMVGYGSNNYCDSNISPLPMNEVISDLNGESFTSYIIKDDILYYARWINSNKFIIRKYKIYIDELGLLNYYETLKLLVEKEITIINSVYSNKIVLKISEENVYINASSDNNEILIDITDFDNIKEYTFKKTYNNKDYIAIRDMNVYIATGTKKIEVYSLIDTNAKLDEINVNNDIRCLSNINGYIYTGQEIIDKNHNVKYISNSTSVSNYISKCGKPRNNIFLPLALNLGTGSKLRLSYGILKNYLATINNLQTPITKTSAQTMKITYTLTEE